ncbi:hypothetical protein MPER_05951, partial [Moniliophthora perniciosa FA553]
RILLEGPYAQGITELPPHLSPFGDYEGAYDPLRLSNGTDDIVATQDESESEMEEEDEEDAAGEEVDALKSIVAADTDDVAALRTAELVAEAAGIDPSAFEKELAKSRRKAKKSVDIPEDKEKDMNKMMMSNKQRKLYEKMKYSQNKRASERAALEEKKRNIQKQKRKAANPRS